MRLRCLRRIIDQRSRDLRSFHSCGHDRRLFNKMAHSGFACVINSTLLDCMRRNCQVEVLVIFREQIKLGFLCNIDEATVAIALKACRWNPKLGHQLHCFAVSSGFASRVIVSNSLMNMYSKCGQFYQARRIFEQMNCPNLVSWNTILSGFTNSDGALDFALRMNREGIGFGAVTCTTILSFCSVHLEFLFGFQLHSLIMKNGFNTEVFVVNALGTMYSRWGRLLEATVVFDEMPHRDLVTWNALLSAYIHHGHASWAILIFFEMFRDGIELDHISFTCGVSACGLERNLVLGEQIHGLAIKVAYGTSVGLCNVLISMYDKCNAIDAAKMVFKGMIDRDVVSWTAMMTIDEEKAVSLFLEMRINGIYPTDVTVVGLLHAISIKELIQEGRMVHGFCVKSDFVSELTVSSSLITMYAKLKSMPESVKIFSELNNRDTISWNSLISGYALNELYHETLQAFFSQIKDSQPDHYTFGSVLGVIGAAEAIPMRHGQRCHSHLVKLGLNADPFVSCTLLDMYAKRGSILDAHKVFNETKEKGRVAWTTMINAHARHGDYKSVMALFEEMERDHVLPDSITFLSILTACSQSGAVDTGCQVFKSMTEDYHIQPLLEHYSCVVDMLARSGQLEEALKFMDVVESPAGQPAISALHSLLGFCRMYGNMELSRKVVEALVQMDPMNSASYVVLSNLFAEKGEWEEVARIRKRMRSKGLNKEGGLSWVDVGDGDESLYMCGFFSDDKSHPQSQEIYQIAKCLALEMKYLQGEREMRRAIAM